MSNINVVNFNSGNITPQLDARKDVEKYTGGCRRLENMIPDVYGNADKRPGTQGIVISDGDGTYRNLGGCYYDRPAIDPAKTSISTPQELQDMQNDLDGDYQLINDIDMTGFDFVSIGHWIGSGTPVLTGFRGTLDGRYFTISNLTTNKNPDLINGVTWGTFGALWEAGIENLVIEGASVTGSINTGILAGYSARTDITNVAVSGTVTDTGASGSSLSGGIIGILDEETIFTRCSAVADIIILNKSSIQLSGGFVGSGSIGCQFIDCYCQSTLSDNGTSDVVTYAGPFGSRISTTGGSPSIFRRCYAAEEYIGTITIDSPNNGVGGFMADNRGASPLDEQLFDNFWDGDLKPAAIEDFGREPPLDVANVTKSTTAAMYQQATYANWDFDDVWTITEDVSYPIHQWYDLTQRCTGV